MPSHSLVSLLSSLVLRCASTSQRNVHASAETRERCPGLLAEDARRLPFPKSRLQMSGPFS